MLTVLVPCNSQEYPSHYFGIFSSFLFLLPSLLQSADTLKQAQKENYPCFQSTGGHKKKNSVREENEPRITN